MAYHISFLCITFIMRISPFNFFEFIWSKFHILFDLYGCKGIGLRDGSKNSSYGEKEEEKTLHQLITVSQPYKEMWSIRFACENGASYLLG